jgi:hypothetical protein
VVASGKSSISQSVDFTAYEGQRVELAIAAVDSIGQRPVVTRNVFVESSAHLSVRAAASGPVWDVSGPRLLFLDMTGTTPALKVLDTADSSTQTVETSADIVGTWGGYGFLTPTGAIYVHGQANAGYPYAWLYEWRAGAVTNLGGLNSSTSLRVAGNWAIHNSAGAVGASNPLLRRDLGMGASIVITESAGNVDNDVAANGDVVYWSSDYNIYRWRNGSTQALTNDSPTTLWNTYPVTDGEIVVYRKHSPCCSAQTFRIAMHDGLKETLLTSAANSAPTPGSGYAVAGGYVAYVAEDSAKAVQIWRHGPTGEQQITFFGSSSVIDAIAPDGTVLLTNTQKRYRATPGSPLQEIGSSLGRVIVRDGKFLVLLDRTVLEVGP